MNEDRQFESVGECDRVFVEKGSGRSWEDRTQLAACIAYLRDGDLLVVASMDRLARSLVDLKQIVGEVTARVRVWSSSTNEPPTPPAPRIRAPI